MTPSRRSSRDHKTWRRMPSDVLRLLRAVQEHTGETISISKYAGRLRAVGPTDKENQDGT